MTEVNSEQKNVMPGAFYCVLQEIVNTTASET